MKKVGGRTVFGAALSKGADIRIPIAHADGRFTISDDSLKAARDRDQVWLEYQDNPNGSIGNVVQFAIDEANAKGGVDGRKLLEIWS